MSWEGGSGWGSGLQSPTYDTNLQPRGQRQDSDPYYNNSQLIDVPSASSYQSSPVSYNSAPRTSTAPKAAFSSSGVVQGLDAGQWKNKETATNCHLCEAAFSSLAKRKVCKNHC